MKKKIENRKERVGRRRVGRNQETPGMEVGVRTSGNLERRDGKWERRGQNRGRRGRELGEKG